MSDKLPSPDEILGTNKLPSPNEILGSSLKKKGESLSELEEMYSSLDTYGNQDDQPLGSSGGDDGIYTYGGVRYKKSGNKWFREYDGNFVPITGGNVANRVKELNTNAKKVEEKPQVGAWDEEAMKKRMQTGSQQAEKIPPPSLTTSGKPVSTEPLGDNSNATQFKAQTPNIYKQEEENLAKIAVDKAIADKEKADKIAADKAYASLTPDPATWIEKTYRPEDTDVLQMMENEYGAKEWEAYNKIDGIGLDIILDTEENSVEELNKIFRGSGIYFEEAGFGRDQIKVISSIDNKFSSVNEEVFNLYPNLGIDYGGKTLINPRAQVEQERLKEFLRDALLKKSEKEYLNRKDLTYENMIKLKIDDPRKYGEIFISEDQLSDWIDKSSLDVASSSKWLKKRTYEINKQIKELEGEEIPEQVSRDLKYDMDRLSIEKDRIIKKQDELNVIRKGAQTAAGYYYAINEEKGNLGGVIGRGLVKGATNLAKMEADLVADLLPLYFGDDATSSLQRSKMVAAGMSDTEINNALTRDLKSKVNEKAMESLQNILSFGTTKEYVQSEKRNDLEKVASFLSESIGTIASSGGNPTIAKLAFFAQSYNAIEEQMKSSDFDELSIFEKKLMSVPYGMAIGYLERLGLKATTGGNKLLNGLVTRSISRAFTQVPTGASIELMRSAINKSVAATMANAGLSIVGGSLIEGAVEGTQNITEVAAKQLFNIIEGKDYFKDVPDLFTKDGMAKALEMASEDFYYGMLGGLVMGAGSQAVSAVRDGYANNKQDANFEVLYNSVTDPNLIKIVKSEIKANLANGIITKEVAQAQMDAIGKSYSIFKSMPGDLSMREKREAFNLIREKQLIEKDIEGKDPSLVDAQTKRVSEINEQLKAISNNAIKETTNQQQAVTTEGGVSEYQGTSEGQQKVGQGEGGQRETTVNETDSGDSTIPSKVQEEVATYRADEQAELLKAIPKIESYKVNGEIDKTLMPKTVLDKYNKIYNKYDKLISPLLETAAPQRVVQEEANKTTDKNYDISQEVNNNIAKANPDASVLLTPKGNDLSLTAVYVGKEKRGKGIGTKVLETVKSEANRTGKKIVLDATNELDSETDLERLSIFYEKNGFKKVGENKFEYNPQEVATEITINKPAIATNTTAEVGRVKSLNEVDEDGATFNIDGVKYEGSGLVVPVISMNTTMEELTPEMISNFVEEHSDKIGDSETVKVGIYKFPNSNQVSIDLNILAPESSRGQAIEFGRLSGQESLFDMGTFENVKTGATGENPMEFTPKQFKEIAKALKEGRMPNVFGTQEVAAKTETDSNKNLVTPENAREVASKQNTPLKQKIAKTAAMIMRSLPGVKIYLHNNKSEMHQALANSTGKSLDKVSKEVGNSRGSQVEGEIHINMEIATATTLLHEAFHEAILRSGKSIKTIIDFANSLKNIISDKDIKAKLDDFVAMYEMEANDREEAIELENKKRIADGGLAMNEKESSDYIASLEEPTKSDELLTELGAIMTEAEIELTTTKLQQFLNLINRIAKSLGLPVIIKSSATAQEAVDFINSMSRSLRTGEVIEGDNKGDGKIKKQAETLFLGETPKFKSLDDVSKYIQSWVNENKLFDKSIEEVSDQEVIDKFSKHVLNEIRAWESIKGSEYVGFYNEDIPQRLNPELQKFAKQRYGRELTGEEVSLYHMVSAFASPAADPHFDSSKGLEVFDKYMMTGDLSAYGTDQATIWDTDSKGKRYDTGKLKFDDKGNPVYKQVAKAYATKSLEKFNNIVNNFNGDVSKAVNWVLSNHSFDDASKMMGKPTTGKKENQLEENEYFTKENGGTGVFAITGAKLGSYILNRIGDYSTVTKDMWYARTLARLAGESLTEKGKAIKSPWASNTKQGLRKRKLADKAFEIVAKELGTNPADVQQKIWDFEKRLYEKLGAVEKSSYASEGLKSKAKQILSEQPSKIKQQKTIKSEPVAGNKLFNEPLKEAGDIAKSYMKSIGKEYVPVEKITKIDEGLSKRISDAYGQMKNDPTNPKVKAAYEAMAKETLDQYDAIVSKGYKVEINNNEPYSSSEDMIKDLRDNSKMNIFSTESGFGDEAITDKQRKENILLSDSGRKDANGEKLLVNDVFRFVHDFFGHAKLGNSFGPIGEENAWRVHSEMYSPEAKKAMTSETRGQNSFVNFSGVNDAVFKKRDKARELRKEGKIDQANQMVGEVYEEMKFADQKVGLLPSFAVEEGSPSKIKLQKTPQETRMDNESESVFKKSLDRGTTWLKATQNALDYIQKSKWYQEATDIEREQKIRDFKQSKNQKLKKAPSVAKVLGKPKPKMVTVNEAAAFKDQLRLEAKAAREAKADLNSKRKSLSDAIKGMVKLGKLKVSQASTIIKRVGQVNLDNPVMVDRLIDYASKVFERADYQERLDKAFSYRRDIKSLLKTDNQAQVVGMANEFAKIDPSMVENIDDYIAMAEIVKNAVAPSKVKVLDVVLKEAANIELVSNFSKDALEKQDQKLKDELLATNNDLLESGAISGDMTIKEIQEILNAINDPTYKMDSKEKERYVRSYLSKRFESLASIVTDIIKTNQNPFTGEKVAISEKDRAIILDLLKVDLSEMSIRDAIFAVEAMDNFVNNGITSKLEGALSAYKGQLGLKEQINSGKVARALKLYFSKKIGRYFATEFTPLSLMVERMFSGVKSGISVMKSMGLAVVINGVNKANYLHDKIINEYYEKFIKNSKTFHNPENVYERGMLSFLKRNVTGSLEEMKAETSRRVDMIKESIDTLMNDGDESQRAMAEIYQKVFDKLDVSSGDMDLINSMASKENRDAVDWWVNQWSKHYQDLHDVSLSVYNYDLGSDVNYTPDRYKTIKTESFDEKLTERNSSFLISMDHMTDKNKTGVLMQANRPKVMPDGRYISLDFDTNNSSSLKGALVDINTAAGIRQVDGFLNSKSLSKLIPTSEDRDVLIQRTNRYIRRAKGKIFIPSDLYKDVDAALNFAASLGVGKALGGVLQSVKQTIPIAISTAIMTGKFNMSNFDFNEWLNKTGMPISNRGIESLSTIESIDRRMSAKGTRVKDSLKWIQEKQQLYVKWFLSKPDVFIARSGFQSYYLQYMGEKSIDWANHEPNQDALNYAQSMVDRQQNISDPMLGGEFLTAEDGMKRMAKKILFPFASFSLNQKARLNSDIINIGSKTTSAEDRKIAFKSATATVAEMVAYRAIAVGIGYGFYKAAAAIVSGLVGDDDDEDKENDKKWFESATKFPVKSMINDIFSPIQMADKYVTMSTDFLLSLTTGDTDAELDELVKQENEIRSLKDQDPMTEKQEEKFRQESKNKSLYQVGNKYDDNAGLGMVSIASDLYTKIYDDYSLAMTGEFEDDYKGNITIKRIRPIEQDLMKNTLYFSTLFAMGILPKESDQVVTKIVNMVKKNAMSESEYTKYEAFKKEFKREPSPFDMGLIKSDKEYDYISKDIDWVNRKGGLNLAQGREYVKLLNIMGEVTTSTLLQIKAGKTADQIAKSMRAKL